MIDQTESLRALELFAGGGGMALGVGRAGFETIALLENNRDAVDTLKMNAESGIGVQPLLEIVQTDVRDFDFAEIEGAVDLLSGGAACQPFSLAGKHKGHDDERNLFPQIFRAQSALWPRAILIENVRGLARASFRPYLEYLILRLALPGVVLDDDRGWRKQKQTLLQAWKANDPGDLPAYDIWMTAIECANFGVPQTRNRIFIVAIQSELGAKWNWPEPTHSDDALLYVQHVSMEYWERHGLQGPTYNDLSVPSQLPDHKSARLPWVTVRDALLDIPEPRMGEAHPHHENHIGVPGARSYPPGHTGSPLDAPSKTLKAGVHGVPGGENMIRFPDGSVRYYTVHEAALLQTLPDSYVISGSRTQAHRQIGNAAPTLVAEKLANQIYSALLEHPEALDSAPPHIDFVEGQPLHNL